MRSFLVKQMLRRQEGFFDKVTEFEKTQYYSENEIEDYQDEKLQRLIKHAYDSVPFYKELFNRKKLKPSDIRRTDDLEKLPILDKESLRTNHDRLLSSSFRDKTYIRTTGGSTGVPLRIVNNSKADVIERALYFRFLKWMGYEWGDEIVLFWGEHVLASPLFKLKKRMSRRIYNFTFYNTYDVNNELMTKIIEKLKKAPPRILRGYTSAIYYLACKASESGMPLPLNAVTTTAEKLYAFQRRKIEEAFGKNVFDQYGCGETNSLAFECERHKGLHVASEHVALELVDNQGRKSQAGNVVITNLDDYAMPIIRYHNGDQAVWSSTECDCRRHLPLLERIEGRVYDYIEGPNGNRVHTGFFDDIFLDLDLDKKYAVKEFRIVQKEIDRITIEFVTEKDISPKDNKIIEEKVSNILGPITVNTMKVSSIPLTKMGKKMFVLSMLNRDRWHVNEPL
jgi:phenylacetate-coenzyme A ligase PaaK-like adenylate-forming protein